MSGQVMTANLPVSPLGTTKSIATGVSLQVWEAQRSAGAVTIVFSLNDVNGGNISTNGEGDNDTDDVTNLEEALSSNPNADLESDGTSNVSIFDPANVTDYETFCKVAHNGELSDCLDSADVVELQHNGATQYFAAVVAEPPMSDKRGTVVTGVGSVPDVPISG
jgi:hypothetical protein